MKSRLRPSPIADGSPKIVVFGLFSAWPDNSTRSQVKGGECIKNISRNDPLNHVEANGARLRRATCGRCGEPVRWLGEAIRVDCVEGRFVVLHVCLTCTRACAAPGIRREAA